MEMAILGVYYIDIFRKNMILENIIMMKQKCYNKKKFNY